MERWSLHSYSGFFAELVIHTCWIAWRRSLLREESFSMMMPRRGRMWLGVDVRVGFSSLLKCTFLTEMIPSMSKHVFSLESSGGNGK